MTINTWEVIGKTATIISLSSIFLSPACHIGAQMVTGHEPDLSAKTLAGGALEGAEQGALIGLGVGALLGATARRRTKNSEASAPAP